MKKVSVIASRPRKWKIGSWLIRKFLKTDYSHVSYCFYSSTGTHKFYYECVMSGGVRFCGELPWTSHNLVVFQKDFEIEDDVESVFLGKAMDYCGIEYGWWQNAGIVLARWFKIAYNVFGNKDDKSVCSELIWMFAFYVGLKFDKTLNQDLVTPVDIVEACRRMNG